MVALLDIRIGREWHVLSLISTKYGLLNGLLATGLLKDALTKGPFFYANEMLLEDDYDMASADLISYAVEKGWYDPPIRHFSFKAVYGDKLGEGWNGERVKQMDLICIRRGG